MTERPIIFSAPMVRALLAGTKTQTRRVVLKNAPPDDVEPYFVPDWKMWCFEGSADQVLCVTPYQVGDRLWVRETWKPHSSWARMKPREIPVSKVFYRADDGYAPSNTPWVPPIHMPRWASRITLTVTDVRVERLQAISGADTIAEGVECTTCAAMAKSACGKMGCPASRLIFSDLWNSINGPGAWEANPWVVALTFTVDRDRRA